MIRNDSITVWRISAEINCYFVKRSRLDPIRNFPTKSVKPKAVNSNPRHEHKFSQCLHSCLGDVMSPSLSVRSSSPLPASRSNWQDESLSSTPNARTHDNCICFVYSWTLFVFDVGGEPNPVPTLRLGGRGPNPVPTLRLVLGCPLASAYYWGLRIKSCICWFPCVV